MTSATFAIVTRYIHLAAMALALGGLVSFTVCFKPSLRLLDESLRRGILDLAQRRFHRLLYFCIAALLLTGVYGWMIHNKVYSGLRWEIGSASLPIGQMLIGIKVLLALSVFAVVILRGAGVLKPSKFWVMYNLHAIAVIILLASILHYLRGVYVAAH